MKNVIKRITAVAMAFTMLGTGTAITKTISPQSVNFSVTASAACNHSCPYATYSNWYDSGRPREMYEWRANWWDLGRIEYRYLYYQKRTVYWHCKSCGKVLYTTYEYRTYKSTEWVKQ